MKTSNNSWIWAAYDISDEKPQPEKFCGKLTSKEEFERFGTEFNKYCEVNATLISQASSEEKSAETNTETKTEEPAKTEASETKTEAQAQAQPEAPAE